MLMPYSISAFRPFIVLTLTVLISACVSRHHDVSRTAEIANNIATQDLTALTQYKVRGKLAIITANERKSAYLSWQQKEQTLAMSLNTVVGTNIATLDYDGEVASLKSDDNEWQDAYPDELIYRITGWQVPVNMLDQWMKGQVKTALVDEFYDNGLVKQFTSECDACLRWKITYGSYAEFELNGKPYTLPSSLRLVQTDTETTLVLRIDRWLPIDA